MSKNLVIVESPAKAKTIEKYLGKGFRVLSSIGHIRSIPKKAVGGKPPIDIKNDFKTQYEIDPDKKKIIIELKQAVKKASAVWLATDEDREGEAIAWHLCEVLKLDPKKTKRIVFHEITKSAIEEATKEPRTVDMSLVEAQQARQILDRLVGFELSPVVWQKVPGGKSAGRVQSPAVRLLVEREREIDNFISSFQFKVTAVFIHNKNEFKAELPKRFNTEVEAKSFLESLLETTFTVTDITKSPATRSPAASFTTSTLQQDANAKLGFSSKTTMASAQRLYQEGKITYMRTDSVNLSSQAITGAKNYITKTFGSEYSQVRQFKTKSASAQEAHEAIRPTDINFEKVSPNKYDQRLYALIRNRTLASQMAPAKLEKTVITIAIQFHLKNKEAKSANLVFEAKGEVILFDGFLKVYGNNKKETEILPVVNNGDSLQLYNAEARQIFARPPARYSEGSLVKKLEELGIGRPSTYATIINTIQMRGYAQKGESEGQDRDIIVLSYNPNKNAPKINRAIVQEKTGADRSKLVPTAIGQVMSDFLTDNFKPIVDYGFTATVEKEFDQIAIGALARNVMLKNFYTPFHELVERSDEIDRKTVTKARVVGTDPATGQVILARFGRFGPMLQKGDSEKSDNKPQFAKLPADAKIGTVSLEQALQAFKLPRLVGKTKDDTSIIANIGRFGPYIQVDKIFVSIKPFDPHKITLQQALHLYEDKIAAEAKKTLADFGNNLKIINGRFGPYITNGVKNVKMPKELNFKTLTREQAVKLLADVAAKKRPYTRINNSKN
jgi:DNA topoisomerase-1